MASRKTQFIRFRTEFVVKFEHVGPFDSVGAIIGPPDIHAFITAGFRTLLSKAAINKAYILRGSRFAAYLHFPTAATLAEMDAEQRLKAQLKKNRKPVKKARKKA